MTVLQKTGVVVGSYLSAVCAGVIMEVYYAYRTTQTLLQPEFTHIVLRELLIMAVVTVVVLLTRKVCK